MPAAWYVYELSAQCLSCKLSISSWCCVAAQLADLKSKLAWKGVGKQAIKSIIVPGEPDLDAKQPTIPMHGGVC